jgi:hypothetical protein
VALFVEGVVEILSKVWFLSIYGIVKTGLLLLGKLNLISSLGFSYIII